MKNKRRKQRPQPPRWAWLELDGCWFCKNRNACNGCRVMKRIAAEQKEKQKRRGKGEDYNV